MKENKKRKTKPFCTLVVARLSSSDESKNSSGHFYSADLPRRWAFILSPTMPDPLKAAIFKGIADKVWTLKGQNPELEGRNLDLEGLRSPGFKIDTARRKNS